MPYRARSLALAVALAALTLPAAVSAQAAPARPAVADASGAVYTATNAVAGNSVVAYRRAADGSLSYLDAYSTGGRGSGGAVDPLQSQHSLLLSDDHHLLFAVNSGSGEVSVFAVRTNGRLSPIDRVPSGGGFPNGLAVHGNLLYVLNAGGAGNVTGFRIRRSGHLAPISGSTRLLSGTSAGGASIDFSPDGTTLAATERLTNRIDTFPVGPDGAAGAPVLNASNGKTPFSLTFTPQGTLVVAEAAGNPAGGSALSSYGVRLDSSLSTISASVPTGFNAACWVIATADGHYAYSSNAGSNEISEMGVGDDGTLTVLGAASTGPSSTPIDIALTANSRFLYSLNTGNGTISGFRVEADGSLTSIGGIPSLPAASGQNGLAAY